MADIIDCAGTPPLFFDTWTYSASDQLPNLHKGVLDPQEVIAVQSSMQATGRISLGSVQCELAHHAIVGTHAAEWYLKDENVSAFRRICPFGYMIFLEKFCIAGMLPRVACLYVKDGKVTVDAFPAYVDRMFGAEHWFAVRGKQNVS